MSKPTATAVVNYAKKFVRSKPYKAPNMFTKWFYGNNTVAPWCAIFVYYCLAHTGGKDLMKGCPNKAYCPTIWNWAKSKGYTETRHSKAKAGDLVLFDWNKDKVCDHVGFVIKDNGDDTITTVEGNTSNTNNSNGSCVQIRHRSKSVVKGFVRLPYAKPKAKTYSGKWPNLTKKGYLAIGDHGENVKRLQRFLNWYWFNLDVDGIFGTKTKNAVMIFQRDNKLEIDGKFGKKSLAKAKTIKR